MGEDGFQGSRRRIRLTLSRRNDAAGPAASGLRLLTTGSGVLGGCHSRTRIRLRNGCRIFRALR